MENQNRNFGAQVKMVRGQLLLTQEELARQMGVTTSTISRWENSTRAPSFLGKMLFEKFCKANGIEFSDEG